jgi:predicted GNAT family acetyltransferase
MHPEQLIVNNKRAFRFEAQLPDGEYVSLSYRWLKATMLLMQVTEPPAAKGTGITDQLIKHVLDHASAHGLTIMVYSPEVTAYMVRHTEYNHLLA